MNAAVQNVLIQHETKQKLIYDETPCVLPLLCLDCRHDLDLLIELRSDNIGVDMLECFDGIHKAMSQSTVEPDISRRSTVAQGKWGKLSVVKTSWSAEPISSGWNLEQASAHWMRLSHPRLRLQVDIKV
jgi:hypothetical protein